MVQAPGNPRPTLHRLVLMPWRWNRGTWAVVVPLVICSYLLSVPFVEYTAVYLSKQPQKRIVLHTLRGTYSAPANWCREQSPTLKSLLDWERRMVYELIYQRPYDPMRVRQTKA